mmetsp:Transcript_5173/g.15812  ORF Transcript_5173/g.15812 Transcript_5173/m.15812 type:complete len:239 (+) Transcript_5173:129-845(+)
MFEGGDQFAKSRLLKISRESRDHVEVENRQVMLGNKVFAVLSYGLLQELTGLSKQSDSLSRRCRGKTSQVSLTASHATECPRTARISFEHQRELGLCRTERVPNCIDIGRFEDKFQSCLFLKNRTHVEGGCLSEGRKVEFVVGIVMTGWIVACHSQFLNFLIDELGDGTELREGDQKISVRLTIVAQRILTGGIPLFQAQCTKTETTHSQLMTSQGITREVLQCAMIEISCNRSTLDT